MTDTESKVRRIARWMGLHPMRHEAWSEDRGLAVLEVGPFRPHAPEGAIDRERVARALRVPIQYSKDTKTGQHIVGILHFDGRHHILYEKYNESFGLAFIGAVDQWLDVLGREQPAGGGA